MQKQEKTLTTTTTKPAFLPFPFHFVVPPTTGPLLWWQENYLVAQKVTCPFGPIHLVYNLVTLIICVDNCTTYALMEHLELLTEQMLLVLDKCINSSITVWLLLLHTIDQGLFSDFERFFKCLYAHNTPLCVDKEINIKEI